MSDLKKVILDQPEKNMGFGLVIRHWESRRGKYNLAIFSAVVLMFLTELSINSQTVTYWQSYLTDVIYCFALANAFYSVVYPIEFASKMIRKRFLNPFEIKSLYNIGIGFSMVLVIVAGVWSIIKYAL